MTKILAHRGFSEKYPENTMLAFKEAAKYDIAGFELDVQRTKDGVLVITHDEELSRLTGVEGLVVDKTLKELKELDFRVGMDQYELNDDTKIPTLREFFDWFVDTSFVVNIELKTNVIRYEGLVDELVDIIKEYDLVDRVIISSFNHKDVVRSKELLPGLKCGVLTWSVLTNPGEYVKDNGVDYYHPDYQMMDPEDWEQCRKLDVKVCPYTVNDPEALRQMASEGALYVITDNPVRALEALKV